MANQASATEPIVSINITPFVDVVLVLLIIFMATSSYIVSPAIEVDLPPATSGADVAETSLVLVLTADGKLYLNGNAASTEQVAAYCKVASAKRPKLQASIAADGATRHADVVKLIDLVKLNGISSFALDVEAPANANANANANR